LNYWLSESVSGYSPVFLAIRQYSWLFASISYLPSQEIEKAKLQDQEMLNDWNYMHSIAGRMLNRDIDAYFEVIQVNPLDDLVGFGSGFQFGTDDPNVIQFHLMLMPKM
jgi:hypothetical protein